MNVRRTALLSGVGAIAIISVVVLRQFVSRHENHRPQPSAPVMATVVNPPDAGPVAAALAAVNAQAARYRTGGAAAVKADIEERAADGAGPALAAEFAMAAERVAQTWPEGPTGWWIAPLATRLTNLAPERASVEIWLAEVVIPPTREPYGDWRTTTLELHREAGVWKIARSKDGPAPFLRTDPGAVPVSHAGIVAFLAGFEGVDRG